MFYLFSDIYGHFFREESWKMRQAMTSVYKLDVDQYLTGVGSHLHGDQYEVDQSADSTETNGAELQQSWEAKRAVVSLYDRVLLCKIAGFVNGVW